MNRLCFVWRGHELWRPRGRRPVATVIPDPDQPYQWRARMRDGTLYERASLARAREMAEDAVLAKDLAR